MQGAGWLGLNDVAWGQTNNTGMPPDQESKQSLVMNLSLYKHCRSFSSFFFFTHNPCNEDGSVCTRQTFEPSLMCVCNAKNLH